MRPIEEIIIEWLRADDALGALVDDRIATGYRQEDGLPAVIVGSATGGPDSDGFSGVSYSGRFTCQIGVVGGRQGDRPDYTKATPAASAIVDAARAISDGGFTTSTGERIVHAVVTTMDRELSPDDNAVVFVSLELQIYGL